MISSKNKIDSLKKHLRLNRNLLLEQANSLLYPYSAQLAFIDNKLTALQTGRGAHMDFLSLIAQSDWDIIDLKLIVGYVSVMTFISEVKCSETPSSLLAVLHSSYKYVFVDQKEFERYMEHLDSIKAAPNEIAIHDVIASLYIGTKEVRNPLDHVEVAIENMDEFVSIVVDPVEFCVGLKSISDASIVSNGSLTVDCKFFKSNTFKFGFKKQTSKFDKGENNMHSCMWRLGEYDVRQQSTPFRGDIFINHYRFQSRKEPLSMSEFFDDDSGSASEFEIDPIKFVQMLRKLGFGLGFWSCSNDEIENIETRKNYIASAAHCLDITEKEASDLFEVMLGNSLSFSQREMDNIREVGRPNSLKQLVENLQNQIRQD